MNIFKRIGNFFLCFLREDCEYSIKKLLVYVFSGIAIYLILFTTKDAYEVLAFVALLLGIRMYERVKAPRPTTTTTEDPLLTKKKVLTD
jgi:hypothetical protein